MPPKIPDIKLVRKLVPPLSKNLHKGQAGRVGVVGGSEDYTGAPFFSGMASMKLGADLCHIFCEPGAGTVIKSYSPDLIVHPYMRTSDKLQKENHDTKDILERITSVFSRLHVLVVGPGLSRDDAMQQTAKDIILKAREKDMAIVIDADGLYLVQQHPETVKGYKKAVLTPNVVEFKRLCEAMNVDENDAKPEEVAMKLSKAFDGVTIIQKGGVDIITNGNEVFQCDVEGGAKRMGGQGDILSGTIATFLAWGKAYEDGVWEHPPDEIESKDIALYATWAACYITKSSSKLSYEKFGRSVLTSHMLEEIGASYDKFMKQ